MAKIFHFFASMLLFAAYAYADGIPQGHYITDGGWGELSIHNGKDGVKMFAIDTVGANRHMCSLGGKILPSGKVQVNNDTDGCVLSFKEDKNGMHIIGDDSYSSPCHSFCGSRAHFTGHYNSVQDMCRPQEVKHAIILYEISYIAEEIDVVNNKIMPILRTCSKTITKENEAALKEVIALTHYHAGNKAACREALAPYRDIILKKDNDEFGSTPADDVTWRSIAKKLRDISELCK